MTSDSGLVSQDSDYARHIQEALDELHQMQQTPRLVMSPEELEALEHEMRQRTADYVALDPTTTALTEAAGIVLPDARFEAQMRLGGVSFQPIPRAFCRGRVPQARI